MRIEHISTINTQIRRKETTAAKKQNTPSKTEDSHLLQSKFNDHLIAFKSRVDKGLDRFYEANKNRMPLTVRRYVSALEDKSLLTPAQAQQRAFTKLNDAKNVHDIKNYFPDEELFSDLIEPENSKATRGILQSFKENAELLALSGDSILKDNSDFTVYLVKKVFLETKTIDEINKDLENDLNEDFKADFKFKNKDAKYIYSSTLKSLGIQMPPFEYQQSLRYTRDGYSDAVGENIARGQRNFWDSLSSEERTARAKKSVEKFENWWNSFTNNQKLDMIADQLTAIELLKDFKKQQTKESKSQPEQETTETETETNTKQKQHTKTGSLKLSRDELFIKWASNNLKLFEANLTEAEKDTLHLKRMQRLTDRWSKMTAAEKTDYVSKMKSGLEPLRYTMIDAWNHSMDLIKDLSVFLREKQIYKPADILYSSEQFSSFQSQIMSEFWFKYPDYATSLGNNIKISQEKVNTAIKRGTFEELKKQIMRDKNQRIKELAKLQTQNSYPKKPANTKNPQERPEYMKDFIDLYKSHGRLGVMDMPEEYWKDFFDTIQENSPEFVRIWTKQLKGEYITPEEEAYSAKIRTTETHKSAKISRAIEAAMASVVYDCLKNPDVYKLSTTDLKTILFNIYHGSEVIRIKSHQLNEYFEFPVKSRKIDAKKIAYLYDVYKKDMTENELNAVVYYYFSPQDKESELKEYLQTYGKSILPLFSLNSLFSEKIKSAMYEKFKNRMPENLKNIPCALELHGVGFEEKLKQAKFKYGEKMDFLPKNFLDIYFNEIAKHLRISPQITVDEFEKTACKKRKNTTEHMPMMVFPKNVMMGPVKLYTLAMEQALADVLYEATGNIEVYRMSYEELCNNIELFRLVKKFPSENRHYDSFSLKKEIDISAKKHLNLSRINTLYKEYLDNIKDWMKENAAKSEEPPELVDLLYCLNPDEDMPEKDKAVVKRILDYEMNLSVKPPIEPHIAEAVAEG